MKLHQQFFEIVAYGDAMGLPYETRTKTEIARLGGVSKTLIEPSLYSDFVDFRGEPVGTWSDDAQHALISAESFIAMQRFDLLDHALRLKAELPGAKGWGGSTKDSIGRITEAMSYEELQQNGQTEFFGCGPLMRSQPLAIWSAFTGKDAEQEVIDNTTLTHNTPENIVSSLTHHAVLRAICLGEFSVDASGLLDFALETALGYEQRFQAGNYLSASLQSLKNTADIAEALHLEVREKAFRTWAVQATAYAVFVQNHHKSLQDCVMSAVQEDGDADSSASMVASMWALANPSAETPQDLSLLQQPQRLANASRYFADLVHWVY